MSNTMDLMEYLLDLKRIDKYIMGNVIDLIIIDYYCIRVCDFLKYILYLKKKFKRLIININAFMIFFMCFMRHIENFKENV